MHLDFVFILSLSPSLQNMLGSFGWTQIRGSYCNECYFYSFVSSDWQLVTIWYYCGLGVFFLKIYKRTKLMFFYVLFDCFDFFFNQFDSFSDEKNSENLSQLHYQAHT